MLNVGCFGPGLLSFFAKGFLTAYWRTSFLERLKILEVLLALLRHSSICESRNILLCLFSFTLTELRSLMLASSVHPHTDCGSSPQFCLFYNSNAPYSTADAPCTGSKCPADGKPCLLLPASIAIQNPPTPHPELQLLVCLELLKYRACVHPHVSEFLTACGWEAKVSFILTQLPPRRHHGKTVE